MLLKKTNDKPSIIKKDNLTLDNITGEILYIKAQNLDYPVFCPLCNQEMKIRDSKRRYIKLESGNRIPINLKRYYCSKCQKIHTEIPDLITPYKQYDTSTIEKIKSGDISSFAGDDSTIREWKRQK